jgi:predicted nucleotidyltransferase
MEMPSFATSLAIAVESTAIRLDGLVEIWLFGSAVTSPLSAADIDLLVVYSSDVIEPVQAERSLREPLESAVARLSDLEVHIVLFTEEEAAETRFAERESAQLIFPRPG